MLYVCYMSVNDNEPQDEVVAGNFKAQVIKLTD